MLWSTKLSLVNIHVRLAAKGLLRNLQQLSGCRKNTGVFYTGLFNTAPPTQETATAYAAAASSVLHRLISLLVPFVLLTQSCAV